VNYGKTLNSHRFCREFLQNFSCSIFASEIKASVLPPFEIAAILSVYLTDERRSRAAQ